MEGGGGAAAAEDEELASIEEKRGGGGDARSGAATDEQVALASPWPRRRRRRRGSGWEVFTSLRDLAGQRAEPPIGRALLSRLAAFPAHEKHFVIRIFCEKKHMRFKRFSKKKICEL